MKKKETCSLKDLRSILAKKTPLTVKEKRFLAQAQKAWEEFPKNLLKDFIADKTGG